MKGGRKNDESMKAREKFLARIQSLRAKHGRAISNILERIRQEKIGRIRKDFDV